MLVLFSVVSVYFHLSMHCKIITVNIFEQSYPKFSEVSCKLRQMK